MTVCDVKEADIKRVNLPQIACGIPPQMNLIILSHIESFAGYHNISSYLFLFFFWLYMRVLVADTSYYYEVETSRDLI